MENMSRENSRTKSRSSCFLLNNTYENRKLKSKITSRNPFFNFLRSFRREHPGNIITTASMAGMIWNKMSEIEKEPFRIEAQHSHHKTSRNDTYDKPRKKMNYKSSSVSFKLRNSKSPKSTDSTDLRNYRINKGHSYTRFSRCKKVRRSRSGEGKKRKSRSCSNSTCKTRSASSVRGRKKKRRMSKDKNKRRRRRSNRVCKRRTKKKTSQNKSCSGRKQGILARLMKYLFGKG